ncbi:MAG: diaminopimelate epimerase [Candidatus Omnitrophica bacterium]|nr:diaminopimelate epimerase [Candidatus Omnitrophota bacterium]
MEKMKFTKMVATGNDFVIIDNRGRRQEAGGRAWPQIAKVLCARKTGIGADGLLALEKSNKADFKMRVINADGSEAEMCGNGLRCAAMYACGRKKDLKIETLAGIYEVKITGRRQVRIKMEEPRGLRLNIDIKVNDRELRVDYIDSGVPHTVIFVQGLDGMDVDSIGRAVRYHAEFGRRGANVDFVEMIDDENIKMRTYERGVEGETLACGTGAVASGIISNRRQGTGDKVKVHTKGGVLKVCFKNKNEKITDVYLEGEVKKVYAGEVDYV